jgi:hypothetical protein
MGIALSLSRIRARTCSTARMILPNSGMARQAADRASPQPDTRSAAQSNDKIRVQACFHALSPAVAACATSASLPNRSSGFAAKRCLGAGAAPSRRPPQHGGSSFRAGTDRRKRTF